MAVKVSVVVAVYNPGANIDRLMDSLVAQSLPVSELEVVFVDDESTDGTLDRLRAFASERGNVVVRTIPNSGWPGRPRNIGTDLARGEYVYFADHDDEFFPEALARMYDLATANRSDIVYGKLVTPGSSTPFWPLARRTIGRADLVDDDLLINRMVHKLYRRQFLLDHAIRFAEGPVRLEDHMFMAQAMPLAESISVLADYPCYRWIVRTDGTNNSTDQVDFPGYWHCLAASMRLFTERAGPGRADDAARAWAGQRMLLHARPGFYLSLDDEAREAVLSPLYDLVRMELPDRVDPQVPVLKRLRLQHLRARDRESFDRVQELTASLAPSVALDRLDWQDGVLHLAATAELRSSSGEPLEVHRHRDRLVLPIDWDPVAPASARMLLWPDAGTLELTVRHRYTGVEWPLPGKQHHTASSVGEGVNLGVVWEGEVDVWNGAFGSALDDGIWDVLARVQFLGEARIVKVPLADRSMDYPPATRAQRRAVAYGTASSNLAIKISPVRVDAPRPRVITASWQRDLLHLTLAPPVAQPAVVVVRERGQQAHSEAPVVDGAVAIAIGPLRAGRIMDLSLRTGPVEASSEQRLVFAMTDFVQQAPYDVYRTAHGSLSVRYAPPDAASQPVAEGGPVAKTEPGSRVVRGLARLRRRGR
jgi:poly(ribitol-phosphate) beta-N-acetylglucosaminyltransferase